MIAQLSRKVSFGMARVWEDILQLHINPKPKRMKQENWEKLVRKVVYQTEERIYPPVHIAVDED